MPAGLQPSLAQGLVALRIVGVAFGVMKRISRVGLGLFRQIDVVVGTSLVAGRLVDDDRGGLGGVRGGLSGLGRRDTRTLDGL